MIKDLRRRIKKGIFNPILLFEHIKQKTKYLCGLGSLPDYIIIGVQKGGTTSLQEYLIENLDISSASKKEVHYFDNNYFRGLRWYKSHFPIFKKVTGEATPYYIYHPLVAKRIIETLPEVKIIVLLRDPVERAFSHYKMEFNRNSEHRTFEEVIKFEKDELKVEQKKVMKGNHSWIHQCHSYLDRGKYYDQLKDWFNYFDKKNILIIKSEDLRNDIQGELFKVFKFLNVRNFKLKNKKEFNKGKKNISFNPKTKRFLYNHYKIPNKKLYNLLNRNFNWEKNNK